MGGGGQGDQVCFPLLQILNNHYIMFCPSTHLVKQV